MTGPIQPTLKRILRLTLKPPAMGVLLVAGFVIEALVSTPLMAICILDGLFDARRHR